MFGKLASLSAAVGVVAMLGATPAFAADHQVKMLNRGAAGAMVFEPAFLAIQPGDTVTFLATNPSHNAESIAGMLPEGAKPFKGAMNKEVTVRFENEGVYGYKCAPHYGMGMVGLIKVGSAANLAAARTVRHPGKAAKVMADIVAQAATSATASAQ